MSKPKLETHTDIKKLEDYFAKSQAAGKSRPIDAEEMTAALNDRVKGQEHVTQDVARFIRQSWAKQVRGKPIASLLFVGKTGTGKTELAKALTEYLYKDEKLLLTFDCNEFKFPESLLRLTGAPIGIRGTEKGGQLTRAMFQNPKRIVLFDEVEKACSEVLDIFLPMLDEARVSEQGSGKAADFSQAIIILTSNQSAETMVKLREEITDPYELTKAIKDELVNSGKFRPEIAARINKVLVFKELPQRVIAEIIVQKMYNSAKSYGMELEYIDPDLIIRLLEANEKLKDFGIRELQTAMEDMLGEHFTLAKENGCKKVKLIVEPDGEILIDEVLDDGTVY